MDHVHVSLENPHVPTAKTATNILYDSLQGGIQSLQCKYDINV